MNGDFTCGTGYQQPLQVILHAPVLQCRRIEDKLMSDRGKNILQKNSKKFDKTRGCKITALIATVMLSLLNDLKEQYWIF